jgi:hypothetical protein
MGIELFALAGLRARALDNPRSRLWVESGVRAWRTATSSSKVRSCHYRAARRLSQQEISLPDA